MSATQLRGHCQRCGRLQAASWNGVNKTAKHGYQVKDRGNYGWFAGTCLGADHEPIENSRSDADKWIAKARDDAHSLRQLATNLQAGTQFPATVKTNRYDAKERDYVRLPFDQGDDYQKREAVKSAIWRAEQQASAADSYADQMSALCDRVHGQPLTEVVKPEAPAAIAYGEQRNGARGVMTAKSVDRGMVTWLDARGFRGRMSTRSWRLLPIHTT